MPITRKAGEVHFNTREQVREYVTMAMDIADELGLDDADRATLLPQIITLIAGKQVFMEQVNLEAPVPMMAIPRGK